MGAWGTTILSDDTTRDVYDVYQDLFNRGSSPEAARATILDKFSELLKDRDDGPLVWLGMAKAQWDCGQLEPQVFEKAQRIVRDGLGLDLWVEQGKKMLRRRKAVLDQFLSKLQSANPRPKKPKKATKRNPRFNPGDCLAVRLEDNTWGAALVLQHKHESEDPYKDTYGINLVAALRYRGAGPPTLGVFEKREWLRLNHHSWPNEMVLRFVNALPFRSMKDRLSVVCSTRLRKSDLQHSDCKIYCSWFHIPEDIYLQYRWEEGFRD